jgi:hypothetical protein
MKRSPIQVILMGILSLLFGCSESNYYKKSGQWHYDDTVVGSVAELQNFKVIDTYFAKDDRSAFYRGYRISHGELASDPATFEVLNTWYAKDKFWVYFCDTDRDSRDLWSIKHINIKVLEAADPATFQMMSDGYTPRDKSHVFYKLDIVPIRDVASYELLEHSFSKDKISAYFGTNEIVGSDPASFVALDMHYAKDKAKIYYVDGFYIGGIIKSVRAESFRVLGDGYASDGYTGYFKGKTILNRNADSLSSLHRMSYAKTQSQVFYEGRHLGRC